MLLSSRYGLIRLFSATVCAFVLLLMQPAITQAHSGHKHKKSSHAQRSSKRAKAEKITKSLKPGMHGSAVHQLQRALKVKTTGKFDSATERAVKRFQKQKQLTIDGVAGPRTLKALHIKHAIVIPTYVESSPAILAIPTTLPAHIRAHLSKIARCESGGNPTLLSKTGLYRGMFQFSFATWRAVGGKGDPARASIAEQAHRAHLLYVKWGPSQWPNCS